MQKCLREMLFLACKFHFQPVFLRISTADNDIADFISRRHDSDAIKAKFESRGLFDSEKITVSDDKFELPPFSPYFVLSSSTLLIL